MQETEHEPQLILGRFEKGSLIEVTQRYKKYMLKDIYGGQRAEIKIQKQGEVKPTILHEAGYLQEMQGYPGFPLMIWSGNFNLQEMGLVTAKEGLPLPQLLPPSQKTFSLSTVCLLAIDIIKIVETLHDKNAVLSDFRPSNFRIRADRIDKLVVSSLYYCRRYRSSRNLDHYKCKDAYHGEFINHFVSVHRLSSLLTSRRDDLQSYFLLVVYLLKGFLPWSDVPLDNLAKAEQQLFKKIRPVFTDPTSKNKQKLLEGLPREFVDVFDHIVSLKYEERPNYCFIRLKFQKILNKTSKNIQPIYQWIAYLPSIRGPILRPSQLSLATYKDKKAQHNYYDPNEAKIQLDKITHIHAMTEEQVVQPINLLYKKSKKHKPGCVVM